jgi:tetratricopeptide (TPR) repeat protein
MKGVELSDLTAIIAFGLPLLALATVVLIAVRQISKRRQAGIRHSTGRYGEQAREAVQPAAVQPAEAKSPVSASKVVEPAELAQRIAKAEAKSEERELATLYLAHGRAERANGRVAEAAEALRKAIRLSAKLDLKDAHAAARLELGDLVGEQGDLTTACEHWQIARGLFYEIKSPGELAAAEKRMRQNGCPTDWVLNDF